jgi:hypothetical protein
VASWTAKLSFFPVLQSPGWQINPYNIPAMKVSPAPTALYLGQWSVPAVIRDLCYASCCVVMCGTWRRTYSTTEMSPPDLLWTGQGQRRVSPVDRGSPAAPSSPHVQTASDLSMHCLVSQQTQASASASKQASIVFLVIIRTPYGAFRLSGILPGCCVHDSVPLLDHHINHDSPISWSPLSPQPNFANRRQRPPLPPTLIDLACQASRLRR